MFKNTAGQYGYVYAVDTATGDGRTGDAANLTPYLAKDGGSLAALSAPAVAEVDATNAKGVYRVTFSQAETNADLILLAAKSSTAGVLVEPATIATLPTGFGAAVARLDADVSSRLAAGDYTAPDNAGIAAAASSADEADSNAAGAYAILQTGVTLTTGERTTLVAAVWSYLKASAAALATTTIGRYVYDTLASVAGQVAVLGTGQVAVYGALVNGEVRLKQGDTYTEASGQAFDIPKPTGATWPADLTGWTIVLRANANADTPTVSGGTRALQTTLACAAPAGAQTLRLNALTAAQTAGLDPGVNGWTFEIQATSGLLVNTLMSGVMSVYANVTGA